MSRRYAILAAGAALLACNGVTAVFAVGGATGQARTDHPLLRCQGSFLSPGGEGPVGPEGRILRLKYWNLPPVVQPGETVKSRVVWETLSGDPNAVVSATIIGNWDPDQPIGDTYRGILGERGKQFEMAFQFAAPKEPGQYRIRWIFPVALKPITCFYSKEDGGAEDPGNAWWSELVFTVVRGAAPNGAESSAKPEEGSTQQEFDELYRQYSSRYHEKMATEADQMDAQQMTQEASRMWDDTFGSHKDLLKKRCEEILANLPTAPTIEEDQYYEVMSDRRGKEAEQPKQFAWNPVWAADRELNYKLTRLIHPNSYAARSVLIGNANLFWDAIDRNIDHPKLMQRQGPLVYIVDLTRKDDCCIVDRIHFLRPKSGPPLQVRKPL